VEAFQKLNPSVSLFWIEADSESQLEQNYLKLIDELGLVKSDGCRFGLSDIKSWFDSNASGDWLIVYDGINVQSSFYGELQLHKYIPTPSKGRIIFTSRNKQILLDLLDPGAIVQIDGMALDDAENLLLSRSGKSSSASNNVSELLSKLEYVPWAIIQAASFIAKNGISIDVYFEHYTKGEAQRLSLLNALLPNVMNQATFRSSIETWFISFKLIEEESQAAIRLLSYLAMIDKERIPMSILPEDLNAIEKAMALGLLSSHSVIILDHNKELLYVNGLARMFMREYLRSRELFEHQYSIAQLCLLKQYPKYFLQQNDFIRGKALIHHVQSIYDLDTRQCVRIKAINFTLLLSLTRHLFWLGRYNNALDYLRFLLTTIEDRDKSMSNSEAATRNIMGLCYMNLANFHEAKLEFQRGMDCVEKGTVIYDRIKNSIGWISYLRGEYEAAAKIFKSILHTEVDESSDRALLRLDVLTNYGLTRQAQGQLNEAETALREVLARRQANQSSDCTKTIDAYSNLATLLQGRRQWTEALLYHCEVLRRRSEYLDENHHDCLRSRANIAIVLIEKGDLNASEPVLAGLLEEFSSILGWYHPETLNLKNNILNVLHQRSLFDEAACLGKDVLAGRMKTLGPTHPDTVLIKDYCYRMDAWRNEQESEKARELAVL
jgi:tetratricopeptide (TPR) repeat protein